MALAIVSAFKPSRSILSLYSRIGSKLTLPPFQRTPRRSYSSYAVSAPPALITANRGTRSINPCCFSSINALPNALLLPRFPPGTTIQSGTSHCNASSTRYITVFCPSRRNGLTLLTR